jgi:hypothetical protein
MMLEQTKARTSLVGTVFSIPEAYRTFRSKTTTMRQRLLPYRLLCRHGESYLYPFVMSNPR